MTPDEKEVRDAWERAEECPRESKMGDGEEWVISLGGFYYTMHMTDWVESQTAAWSAAAAFTRERKEQIRLVEEEIDYVRAFIKLPSGEEHSVWSRILAREQAALAELKRGMRASQ